MVLLFGKKCDNVLCANMGWKKKLQKLQEKYAIQDTIQHMSKECKKMREQVTREEVTNENDLVLESIKII